VPTREKPSVLEVLRSPRLLLRESLAGLVVAIALVPEAISFSFVAGVDPRVGLCSSFVMAMVIAVVGGRPAMVSASTAAVAVVVAPVAREHGLDHLLATVVLGGLVQILLAWAGVARLMRFVPRSVMVGFVNSLATLMLMAQLPHLVDVPWPVYALVGAGIVVMILTPRLTTLVPAALVSVVLVTAAAVSLGVDVPTVGEEGALPDSLPTPGLPQVPVTWQTLRLLAPYALTMAVVGLMESLMTAKLVDEITDTRSSKTREAWGQGVANIVSGLFGGMGGCAVIGQTMMNVRSNGARTRVSTFAAGLFLMLLSVGLGDLVGRIPVAALVAVMVVVGVSTIDWHSLRPATIRRLPRSETFVMLATLGVVLVTRNLAIGVVSGVVVAALLFVRRVAHFVTVTRTVQDTPDGPVARYRVEGELLFASSNELTTQFEYADDPERVVVDLSASHVWDVSSVAALDVIETRYTQHGKSVRFEGMNPATARFHGRLSGSLRPLA
jgi:Sulfate permease and related transporters (MFS superfamily)